MTLNILKLTSKYYLKFLKYLKIFTKKFNIFERH